MEALEDILNKEMSRKEFLTTVGLGIASLFGMSTILHFLLGRRTSGSTAAQAKLGYGSSVYGGR